MSVYQYIGKAVVILFLLICGIACYQFSFSGDNGLLTFLAGGVGFVFFGEGYRLSTNFFKDIE